MVEPAKKHWYEKLPHPYAILFFIILFAAVLTYIVPAGQYTRISIDTALLMPPASNISARSSRRI